MNNSTLKTIALSVITIGFVISLTILYTSEKPQTKAEPEISKPLNDTMKAEFLKGCIGDEVSTQGAFCECTYSKLVKGLGTTKLLEVSLEYQNTSVMPSIVYPLIAECLPLLQK